MSDENFPNIVFLFSDQQRWDTVGCYGQPLDITPNLDKMAVEGVKFEKAFTCQPVCGPARACLQTGLFATEVGCYRNAIALPMDSETLPKYLKQKGYEVGYVGKWHLATTKGNSNQEIGDYINYEVTAVPVNRRGGYDGFWVGADVLESTSHSYDGYMYRDMEKIELNGYRVDATTDFVLEFLDKQSKDKPFFLFTSYIEPHHQNDHNRFEGPIGCKEKYKDFIAPDDLMNSNGRGDWKENYADYLGCCASIDENVGRIREKLDELDLTDNTIIIYTSDHGSHFCTRNSEYKRTCHESAIRIPLIIYGPGFKGGRVIEELVSLIDLPSTILKAADIGKPNHMQGHPLQTLVEDDDVEWRKEVFIQISESKVGRAIRTARWKYSVVAPDKDGWLDSKSDIYIEEFLYDLENDPHESTNLVTNAEYKEIREKLAQRLIHCMLQANEDKPIILNATK